MEFIILILLIVLGYSIINRKNSSTDDDINNIKFNKFKKTTVKENSDQHSGHNIVNGKCLNCGCTETAIKNFSWECKNINYKFQNNKSRNSTSENNSKKTYFDFRDHDIHNGRCRICGYTTFEINHCGWKCRPQASESKKEEYKPKDETTDFSQRIILEQFYEELFDFKKDTDKENLRKKYLELIKQYHPDRVAHLGKEFNIIAEKKTKEINDGYEYLMKKLDRV